MPGIGPQRWGILNMPIHRLEPMKAGTPYSAFESMGVSVIVATASVSLLCVFIILGILAVSFWKKRSESSNHFFVRTHAAAYFVSLLVADIIQALGSLLSIKWIAAGGVTLNPFCTLQGAIKNAGNLSISLWTLTLAIHTFCLLFLRWKPKEWVLYTTIMGVWFLVGLIVVLGPAVIQTTTKGPYFGVSGYWCWIADSYHVQRIVFEYIWLLGSAGISFVLYTLAFLRLRGNLYVKEEKLRFRKVIPKGAWKYQTGRDSAEIQMAAVAKGMIGFPILFTVIVVPITVCRFVAWSGKPVPFEATIFADAVFSLTGVFDLILFTTTRSLLPSGSGGIVSWLFDPSPRISKEVMEHGIQPYNVQDFASAHGFNEMYRAQAERTMVTLPPRTSASLSVIARSSTGSPPRPSRPISLGNESFVSGSASILSNPEQGGSNGDSNASKDTERLTTKTVYSQGESDLGVPEPAATWHDVDLGRTVSPERDTFGNKTRLSQVRDTQFTAFSLSAYGIGGGESSQCQPSGAAIDLYAGRSGSDQDSESLVSSSNHTISPESMSDASSMSYDLPITQPLRPVAKKN